MSAIEIVGGCVGGRAGGKCDGVARIRPEEGRKMRWRRRQIGGGDQRKDGREMPMPIEGCRIGERRSGWTPLQLWMIKRCSVQYHARSSMGTWSYGAAEVMG